MARRVKARDRTSLASQCAGRYAWQHAVPSDPSRPGPARPGPERTGPVENMRPCARANTRGRARALNARAP